MRIQGKHATKIVTQAGEFVQIDNGSAKDIVCVPSQTGCRMGCTFCHWTHTAQKKVTNLRPDEIVEGVSMVLGPTCKTLLISYMGAGEPMANMDAVVASMKAIKKEFGDQYETIRFGVSTMMPRGADIARFAALVSGLDVKLHLSLHSPDEYTRRKIIPGSTGAVDAYQKLVEYRRLTGNACELHYTMIRGVNDRMLDISKLTTLQNRLGVVPVKFIKYNPLGDGTQGTPFVEIQKTMRFLQSCGVPCEYYDPPGADIGASCGQFGVVR